MGLFHHVLVYMGDLHLVLPSLNLSIQDAGILIMVQQVKEVFKKKSVKNFTLCVPGHLESFKTHLFLGEKRSA